MSHNYTSTITLYSTLRISKVNAKKAKRLNLPSGNPIDNLTFSSDGYAYIKQFTWYGEDTGNALGDGRFKRFAALLEGEADLVMIWEGESLSGVRIRNGAFTECDVVASLAPEVGRPAKVAKGGKVKAPRLVDDLTTATGIYAAMINQANASTREPTDAEHDGMDGLDRIDYWQYGYRSALEEFAARINAAGDQPQ